MDTPEQREFWKFVSRVAQEVRQERPSWLIRNEELRKTEEAKASVNPQ